MRVAALLEQLAIKQDDISVILILSAETSIQIHVSRRLNILCIIFKIIALFMILMLALLNM
jgi:hypothetical protein